MAKCVMCIFHEKDKRFLPNYDVKTMRFPCVYPNAWKMHLAHLAMYRALNS